MAQRKSEFFERDQQQLFPLTPEMVRELFESYERKEAEQQKPRPVRVEDHENRQAEI